MKFILLITAFASTILTVAQTTITLQPGPTDGKDALIYGCVPCGFDTMNIGSRQDFNAIAWTFGNHTSLARSLIEFDLSQIPSNAIISTAKLSLYHDPSSAEGQHSSMSGPNTVLLKRITTEWNENTVTWSTQPFVTSPNQIILPASTSGTQNYENIEISSLIQDMVKNPCNSHGLMMQLQTENYYRRMIFASSDHPNSALRPKLQVTYSIPTTVDSTLIIRPNAALGKDAIIYGCVPCGFDNMNLGTRTDFNAIAWTFGTHLSVARSLIDFDLSQIPSNATITKASLSLYHDPITPEGPHSDLSGPNTVLLQRITTPWDESTVTWNNQPTVTTVNEVILQSSISTDDDYLDINVLGLIKDILTNPSQSFGLMMKLQDENYYRRMIFASSDHPNSCFHPKLEIHYTVPLGIDNRLADQINLTLYPNPAINNLTIEVQSSMNEKYEVRFIDISGRIISTYTSDKERFEISTADMAKGVYIVQLTNKNQIIRSKKLVIF